MASKRGSPQTAPGVSIDAAGRPATDPTPNVLDLVEAANRRQDDLRASSERNLEAGLHHQREIARLKSQHAREIRELDTKRLDATRTIDVQAAQTEIKSVRDALHETAAAITNRVAALEKSSYEGAGKDAGPSAQMKELTAAMAAQSTAITALALKDSGRSGEGKGIKDLLGYIVAIGGLILAAIAIFVK